MSQLLLAAVPAVLFAALSALTGFSNAKAEVVKTEGVDLNVESLAKLDNPWGMAFLPDGKLLITEKPGRLRIFEDGKLSEPIAAVPEVDYRGQGGLLDVTVDPNFSTNSYVYLSYAEPAKEQPKDAKDERDPRIGNEQDLKDVTLKGLTVARGVLDGNALKDVEVIWRQEPKMIGRGHFGGRIVFAPDGTLFITSGERQRFTPAQDLSSNAGKVVRINPDGSVPKDNALAGKEGRPDIYSIGHRNPLSAAINPATEKLWIVEMGPKGGDELNVIEKGADYGWPAVSDGDHYNDEPIPDHKTRPEFKTAIKVWTPVISPSGMIFYGGDLFPDWRGNALIGALSGEAIVRLKVDGDTVTAEEKIDMGRRIRDVIEAPDGAILALGDEDNAELLRLTPKKGSTPAAAGEPTGDKALP
jgi:aldose sugar dehydrogenase